MDTAILIALIKVISTILISGIIVLRTIPTINHIARSKGLLNAPGERTSHRYKTPNLAGIAIFIAACVSSLLFIYDYFEFFRPIYLASVIIFFVGLKDDIVLLSPWKKLLAQFVAATLIVISDLRFIHGFSVFGVNYFDETASIILTICFIVGIINAINLIDGIDGLAASIGSLILGIFGLFFFINGMYSWSFYCASLVGGLMAFFLYNVFGLRNKTFMGDSGSLLLGLSIAVTTIMFWEANADKTLPLTFLDAPAITFAIIIIPAFDVVRVFFYRIVHRLSPVSADRNHLHHRIVDIGFSHFQTSMILTALNVLMITIAYGLSFFWGTIWISLILIVLMILFVAIVNKIYRKQRKKATTTISQNYS
ncbi:MAG: undecaprenyl/decaprenyl-phosphate alpha-N-acetylglucosaminyl 1-phosphate transferase [Bacteroidales bacterium]|jgi:UDP-N-acetylmuramyl pentapeptide phosphotransferase/UDP-N-acetylglucosamine-1-phosphate transferase|nr:undecaprenyl/decaprenyl-phosphate alpha-N-acetylglucosaminyl 1-phosphate transferase [Bacteroidales bacterium]